jgi:hypothetical protein
MFEWKTVAITAATTASVILLFQQFTKAREISRIKKELYVDWTEEEDVSSEELIQEQLSRNILFLGQEVHTDSNFKIGHGTCQKSLCDCSRIRWCWSMCDAS